MSFNIQNQTANLKKDYALAQASALVVSKERELEFSPEMTKKLADVICILSQEWPKLLDQAVVAEFTGAFFYTEGGAPLQDPAYSALSAAVTCITLGYYA